MTTAISSFSSFFCFLLPTSHFSVFLPFFLPFLIEYPPEGVGYDAMSLDFCFAFIPALDGANLIAL